MKKKLIEVAMPLGPVNEASAREKLLNRGHPNTLHLWWARRPLAACRAMLLALLLPDPRDENCPDDFKNRARELLDRVQGKTGPQDLDLRKASAAGDPGNAGNAHIRVGWGRREASLDAPVGSDGLLRSSEPGVARSSARP